MGTTFSRQVGVTAFQLLFTMLLARYLGKENYGFYALALMLPQLLMKVLNMGMGPSLVYYLARDELSFATGFRRIISATLGLTIVGLSLEYFVIYFFGEKVFPGVPLNVLVVAAFLFPVLLLQELLPNLLLGIQRFKEYNLSYTVFPLVSLIAAWLLLTYVGVEVKYAIIAFALGQLASVIWLVILSLKVMRGDATEIPDEVSWIQLFSYSWKIHTSNIIGFLNYRIDLFLINLLSSAATVGVYFIAVQIVEKLWLLSQAVNTAIFPHLSGKYKRNSKDTSVTEVLGSATFMVTALSALILALLSAYIIELFFGVDYLDSAPVLLILLPGILASSVGRLLSNDFSARGKPMINVYVGLATVSINVLANIYFIPRLGAEGAAWATTISYGFNLCIKLVIYQVVVGVPFWRILLPGRNMMLVLKEIRGEREIPLEDKEMKD